MRDSNSRIDQQLARSLAYLPYRQDFFRQGGWLKAPSVESKEFHSFIQKHFTDLEWQTACQQARKSEHQFNSNSRLNNSIGFQARPHVLPCSNYHGWFFIQDRVYPELLKKIYDPPAVLFYWSSQPLSFHEPLFKPAVAMVGTRNPHRICADVSRVLVREWDQHWIVSGFARGVDRLVHQAALEWGTPTIAVLGSGLGHAGPAANRQLCQQAIRDGRALVLLSEFPSEVPGYPGHFPRRNRIIAGLCQRTIVLQAPHRSGALITARFALEEGRDVAAFDHPVLTGIRGANNGARQLLQDGADLALTLNSQKWPQTVDSDQSGGSDNQLKLLY